MILALFNAFSLPFLTTVSYIKNYSEIAIIDF